MTGFSISGPLYLTNSAAVRRVSNGPHPPHTRKINHTGHAQPRDVIRVGQQEPEAFRVMAERLDLVELEVDPALVAALEGASCGKWRCIAGFGGHVLLFLFRMRRRRSVRAGGGGALRGSVQVVVAAHAGQSS